ncbi:hypothetical protein DMENIID0001_095860 [Sergentomyia squamirostris]
MRTRLASLIVVKQEPQDEDDFLLLPPANLAQFVVSHSENEDTNNNIRQINGYSSYIVSHQFDELNNNSSERGVFTTNQHHCTGDRQTTNRQEVEEKEDKKSTYHKL